ETGAALALAARVDNGQKLQSCVGGAVLAVTVAQRKLDPFVVEPGGDALPLGSEAAPEHPGCPELKRLGGLACRARKFRRRGASGANRPQARKETCDQHCTQRARVIEQPHLTPLVRASARSLRGPRVTGSFRGR